MGILTDFFIATPQEALAADLRLGPASKFPTAQLKSVEIVKVLQLDAILGDHELDFDRVMPLGEKTTEGPWLFQLPPALVDQLAALSDIESVEVARRWAETPEWAAEPGPSRAAASTALREIRAIARRARADEKPVLLWLST
jgi:hypothetical protein